MYLLINVFIPFRFFQAELEELNQNEGPEIEEARTTIEELDKLFPTSEDAWILKSNLSLMNLYNFFFLPNGYVKSGPFYYLFDLDDCVFYCYLFWHVLIFSI